MYSYFRPFCLTAFAAALSLVTFSTAAGTHHPEIEIAPYFLVSPVFQDFSTPIKFSKTIYEDFTAVHTTTTLQLTQDFRGQLVGTAKFASSRTADNRNFNVTGKLKVKKNVITFSLKGSDGNTSVTLNAALTDFQFPPDSSETLHTLTSAVAKQTTNPAELISKSTFLYDVRIKGTTKPYKFAQDAQTTGADFVHYQKAPAGDVLGLPDKKDSDYYLLTAPWGTAMAEGNTQLFSPAVAFTLKAAKFLAVIADGDASTGFVPETYSTKTGAGKYVGAVEP